MAGEVKTDNYHPPYAGRIDIVARTCPVTMRYGNVCCRIDTHSGELRTCPFMYGLKVVADERYHVEGRSLKEMKMVLASEELHSTRQYTVLCMQAPADDTMAGVHP